MQRVVLGLPQEPANWTGGDAQTDRNSLCLRQRGYMAPQGEDKGGKRKEGVNTGIMTTASSTPISLAAPPDDLERSHASSSAFSSLSGASSSRTVRSSISRVLLLGLRQSSKACTDGVATTASAAVPCDAAAPVVAAPPRPSLPQPVSSTLVAQLYAPCCSKLPAIRNARLRPESALCTEGGAIAMSINLVVHKSVRCSGSSRSSRSSRSSSKQQHAQRVMLSYNGTESGTRATKSKHQTRAWAYGRTTREARESGDRNACRWLS
jgi:hypothetical protein